MNYKYEAIHDDWNIEIGKGAKMNAQLSTKLQGKPLRFPLSALFLGAQNSVEIYVNTKYDEWR